MNKNRRVIALGFFDGVHNGHGALLRRVVDKARELDAVAAAFTFDRSPTAAITGQTVPLLSSVEDRGWLMRSRYGIQEVVVSNFDGMMRMDWEDFVDRYLAGRTGRGPCGGRPRLPLRLYGQGQPPAPPGEVRPVGHRM